MDCRFWSSKARQACGAQVVPQRAPRRRSNLRYVATATLITVLDRSTVHSRMIGSSNGDPSYVARGAGADRPPPTRVGAKALVRTGRLSSDDPPKQARRGRFGDTRSPILGDQGDSTQRSLARTGTTSTELEPPTSRIRKQTGPAHADQTKCFCEPGEGPQSSPCALSASVAKPKICVQKARHGHAAASPPLSGEVEGRSVRAMRTHCRL